MPRRLVAWHGAQVVSKTGLPARPGRARIVGRIVVAKQRDEPADVIGGDVEPAGVGINARAGPFRAAVNVEEEIRPPFAAGPKPAGGRTLEAGLGELGRPPRCARSGRPP